MKKVQLKAFARAKYPQLITLNKEGVHVSLTGVDVTSVTKATAAAPEKTVKIRAATESEMVYLFEQGNPFLEEIEVSAQPKAADK